MKFFTKGGVGVVRGDQFEARKCYASAIKDKDKQKEAMHIAPEAVPTPTFTIPSGGTPFFEAPSGDEGTFDVGAPLEAPCLCHPSF